MTKLQLKIKLKSDALIASGEGLGAIIDSDIIFDDLGLPYIPAKRLKGCLKDSILELKEILDMQKIDYLINIDQIFGNRENNTDSLVRFSDLHIEDYENTYQLLNYYKDKFSDYISSSIITSFFTDIRQQTTIDDDGVAKEHSLRTSRVIKKNTDFFGEIEIFSEEKSILKTLELAFINLRRIGTSRNRGFGEIKCELFGLNNQPLKTNILGEMEAVCK